MGIIKSQEPVKLIAGLLFNDKIEIAKIYDTLENIFGEIDARTDAFEFNFTKYYSKEMGDKLFRQYISFKELIDMSELADIKLKTNSIESEFSENGNRNINIDPGYLELGKLVLASTKNYTHRIYIGKNIFAEPTLKFEKKTYTSWPFSYPDYCAPAAINFFNSVRDTYKSQMSIKPQELCERAAPA